MTPYGIVYKDTVPAINEGAEIWRKSSGFVSKKKFFMGFAAAAVSVAAVNFNILNFRADKEEFFPISLMITVMEIISVFFLLRSSLRKYVKNVYGSVSSKGLRQAVLRENDVEFSTSYSKSNYFYEEIEKVIEGVNSLCIIIEKGNLPVCISKSGVIKGEAEKFILILREKMKDRYVYVGMAGGKAL